MKELLPLMHAYAEGKEIQVCHYDDDSWNEITSPDFSATGSKYRIKTEPKTRPMTRGEVLFKVTTTPAMVVRYSNDRMNSSGNMGFTQYDNTPELYEYAIIDCHGEPIDGWHKFEVEE